MFALRNCINKIFVAVLLTAVLPFVLCAETISEPEDNVCFSDQWIIARSSSDKRNEKGVEALREVGHAPLREKDKSASALLIAPANQDVDEHKETEELTRRANLCRALDRKRREALRKRKQGLNYDLSALRDFGCSCNYEVKTSRAPNDSYYSLEWGLEAIGAEAAWDITTGDQETVVFVIDSGIDTTHEDLRGNLWSNPGEIPGDGIDNDGNGYVDDVHGINSINGSGHLIDDHGHGTHCAGTIGAVGNNGKGITGVTWNVRIGGAKFLSSTGSGSLFHAILSIDYTTDLKLHKGVPVTATNNSWGGGGYSDALVQAIRRAGAADILFIAASGNSGLNVDSTPMYPAAYAEDNIISVNSMTAQLERSGFSNYGASRTDIFAPGSNIASTVPGNGYSYMSGTSMATPHVTGAIALVKGLAQNYTALQLKRALLSSVKPHENFFNLASSNGYLFLPTLLSYVMSNPNPEPVIGDPGNEDPDQGDGDSPTPTPQPTPTVAPTPHKFVTLTGTIVNADNNVITNARVEVVREDGEKHTAASGSDGRFSVQNLFAPQSMTIKLSAEGYNPIEYTTWIQNDYDVTIYMTAINAFLEFVVRNPDGQPIGGVMIDVGSHGKVTTNGNGRAVVPIDFGTNYNATASKNGCTFDSVGGDMFASRIVRFILGNCD